MIEVKKNLPSKVLLKEVGPRDGLQNEKSTIPSVAKTELIRLLIDAGISYIEATAFVSPKAIPQLADAEEVAKQLPKRKNLTFSALVPNEKGMLRAVGTSINEVAVFTAASETFNRRNINASIEESLKRFESVFPLAQKEGMKVRGYVSTAFVCPYEGAVDPDRVVDVASRLFDLGCYEVSIGDTIGKATPNLVEKLFAKLLKKYSTDQLAGHYHDTYGLALANVVASLEMGITTFDSSVGGLGGCPYAPGASGNVATEDLVFSLHAMGVETGVSLNALIDASNYIEEFLDHPLPSRVYRAKMTRNKDQS